jgi:hypothetical protein
MNNDVPKYIIIDNSQRVSVNDNDEFRRVLYADDIDELKEKIMDICDERGLDLEDDDDFDTISTDLHVYTIDESIDLSDVFNDNDFDDDGDEDDDD